MAGFAGTDGRYNIVRGFEKMRLRQFLVRPLIALFLLLAGQAAASIDPAIRERALALLGRIERFDPEADGRFLADLARRADEERGIERLRAMHGLIYFDSSGDDVRGRVLALQAEARRQNNATYIALARGRLAYLEYRGTQAPGAEADLLAIERSAIGDNNILLETQTRRLLAYVYWSSGRRELAISSLREAFGKIPETGPDSNFMRVTLLETLQYIHADSGDLEALLETSEQALATGEKSGLPVKRDLIIRNLAYLFRLRGEYETALQFYHAYDAFLVRAGRPEQRYSALFGLALAAQRMGDYQASYDYAREALEDFDNSRVFEASLHLVQSVNLARLTQVEAAREHFRQAEQYFKSGEPESLNEAWQAELLRAEAELARAEGRFEKAMDLTDAYLDQVMEIARAESAAEVRSQRAELGAELARERAERELLESQQAFSAQRLRTQTISLVLLGLLVFVLIAAFLVQRRSARELAISRHKAEAASTAKSRFLANISHELRTPLNAVIGFSEMLGQVAVATNAKVGDKEHAAVLARTRDYAGIIHQSGHHLLEIISDLLSVAQIENNGLDLSRHACDLDGIVRDALDIVTPQARKAGKSVTAELPKSLPSLVVDRRRLKQVLINLLANAIKFTGEHGHVELGVARADDGGLLIEVRDNGIGIPADKLETVFEPFVQAEDGWDRRHEGVGLGLSIVRSIVIAHGGTVAIRSTQGTGTTVSVILPPGCIAEQSADARPDARKASR